MGIRSTQYMSRTSAINRIKEIAELIKEKNHYLLVETGFEADWDVSQAKQFKNVKLEYCTNEQLGDMMDYPFYRFSMFENYIVVNDQDIDNEAYRT